MIPVVCKDCRIIFPSAFSPRMPPPGHPLHQQRSPGTRRLAISGCIETCPRCHRGVPTPDGIYEIDTLAQVIRRFPIAPSGLKQAAVALAEQPPDQALQTLRDLLPKFYESVANCLPQDQKQACAYLLIAVALAMCASGQEVPAAAFAIIALLLKSDSKAK